MHKFLGPEFPVPGDKKVSLLLAQGWELSHGSLMTGGARLLLEPREVSEKGEGLVRVPFLVLPHEEILLSI